ncbi:MAG: hypothetical protein IKF44_02235 [Mycoplasmataceae bacterium]|nr:hypothetical protein [Mycoplasmataceae bacterium]
MKTNQIIRTILITTVVVAILVAIISFSIIMFKVSKKKKEIRLNQINFEKQLSSKDSEIKMKSRADFGQPIEQLQNILKNSISHEIVEFCINSCIRNDYKNVLLVGNVELYEAITLSSKANANVYVQSNNFPLKEYENIKNEIIEIKHNLNILNSISEDQKFDSIMILNSTNNFDKMFLEWEKFLVKNGMFIIANTKSNKKNIKVLEKVVNNFGYKFEQINWYTGFMIIVNN